ncbi:MAG TPA: DsrE family protein [Noviherbaspirillum sp.]|nr:DsrE family protein [Noviherbaspirillum sp.]
MLRKTLLILLFAFAGFTTAGAAEREEKVVYHISDIANASNALVNIRNHLNASPKAKIVVVTHGSGIDFLLEGAKNKTGNPYDIPVQELAARNVEFRVCKNTLEARSIDKNQVLPEASLVPAGVVEISRLQLQEGYAYLKP